MRVLLVAFSYPPIANTGSRRIAGMAEHLGRLGHDVRVLTGGVPGAGWPSAGHQIPVLHTNWIGPPLPADWTEAGVAGPAIGPKRAAFPERARIVARSIYRHCLYMPDPYLGWYPFAIAAVGRHWRTWRPDVVFSSAYPLTSIIVGHTLARRARVPHVAQLGDLWTDNPYRPRPLWARRLDLACERRYLGSARGLVTISQEHARLLSNRYGVPVATVYHGFDQMTPARLDLSEACGLRLVYTGTLHGGRRDPLPLLRGMKAVQDEGIQVRFDYYGPDGDVVRKQAQKAGEPADVRVLGVVSNEEALHEQAGADMLALLMWNHPDEKGTVTGKLFEYMSAGRPILVVGVRSSEAGRIVSEHRLGSVAVDHHEVADALRAAYRAKHDGGLRPLSEAAVLPFSRRAQAERLSRFLMECVTREHRS